MKILYAVHQFLPDFVGGTELDTWEVAKSMRDRGHDVSIVHRASGSGGVVQTLCQGLPVYRLEAGPMSSYTLFKATFGHRALTGQFKRVFEDAAPDLVHFQHLRGLPAGLVGWIQEQGCPVLISLRDFWFVCPNAQLIDYTSGDLCQTPGEPFHCARCALVRAGVPPFRVAALGMAPIMGLRNRILGRVMRQADGLLVYTKFVREWFAAHGAPRSRLLLVPRGIPRPHLPSHRGRGDDDRVRFAYVGGVSWQKGLHVVVQAFEGLPSNAELVIAGDLTKYPDYVASLRKQAKHPGIRFLGRLDRSAVWQALADSDAVVVPSLWYETFSMLAREAFAMGVPVIASDHGALAEAVTHDVNGLLIAPGDTLAWRSAMARFVESPNLRARLTRGVAPPLDMATYIDALSSIYANTVAKQREP